MNFEVLKFPRCLFPINQAQQTLKSEDKTMRRIAFTILFALCLISPNPAFSMSDKLYKQCLQQNDFYSADTLMTKNWKRLKTLLSEDDFKFVLADQRKWVKNGREKEIEYIQSDYRNINLCSLYAISSYARATLLGSIADFLQRNPNYTQQDIDTFIHTLDHVEILNVEARKLSSTKPIKSNSFNAESKNSSNEFADMIIDKAKDAAIEKAVDVGVRWLLKKLIK